MQSVKKLISALWDPKHRTYQEQTQEHMRLLKKCEMINMFCFKLLYSWVFVMEPKVFVMEPKETNTLIEQCETLLAHQPILPNRSLVLPFSHPLSICTWCLKRTWYFLFTSPHLPKGWTFHAVLYKYCVCSLAYSRSSKTIMKYVNATWLDVALNTTAGIVSQHFLIINTYLPRVIGDPFTFLTIWKKHCRDMFTPKEVFTAS